MKTTKLNKQGLETLVSGMVKAEVFKSLGAVNKEHLKALQEAYLTQEKRSVIPDLSSLISWVYNNKSRILELAPEAKNSLYYKTQKIGNGTDSIEVRFQFYFVEGYIDILKYEKGESHYLAEIPLDASDEEITNIIRSGWDGRTLSNEVQEGVKDYAREILDECKDPKDDIMIAFFMSYPELNRQVRKRYSDKRKEKPVVTDSVKALEELVDKLKSGKIAPKGGMTGRKQQRMIQELIKTFEVK